jgi:hypothetical protein
MKGIPHGAGPVPTACDDCSSFWPPTAHSKQYSYQAGLHVYWDGRKWKSRVNDESNRSATKPHFRDVAPRNFDQVATRTGTGQRSRRPCRNTSTVEQNIFNERYRRRLFHCQSTLYHGEREIEVLANCNSVQSPLKDAQSAPLRQNKTPDSNVCKRMLALNAVCPPRPQKRMKRQAIASPSP